jgi:multidrug efflux system outer membrane protein
VAGYRETVLMAFAEVEDNLAAQRFLDKEYHASKYALESASKQLEIARNKYYYGLVTYINVSSAEATALELQRVVNRLRGERFIAAVALIKSLGGSWQISDSVELR